MFQESYVFNKINKQEIGLSLYLGSENCSLKKSVQR